MYRNYTVLALTVLCVPALADKNRPTIFAHFQQMEENMQKMFDQMSLKDQNSVALDINLDKNAITVDVNGLESDTINASLNENEDEILVKTDKGDIQLSGQGPMLYASWNQKTEKQDTDDKGKQVGFSFSQSSQQFAQSVGRPVILDINTLKVDYDKSNKKLTITIPLAKKEEKRKHIQVNNK